MKTLISLSMAVMFALTSYSFAETNDLENELVKQGFTIHQGIAEDTKRNSGRITTSSHTTTVYDQGAFIGQCFWESDFNKNVHSFGVLRREAIPYKSYIQVKSEIVGSYLARPDNARITIQGIFTDYGVMATAGRQTYNLMGTGSYGYSQSLIDL